jgi:hypothetical protein
VCFNFLADVNMVTKYMEQDEVKVKELTLTLHKLRTRNPYAFKILLFPSP